MSKAETEQLLEFIRHEVLPILLSQAVPGGLDVMVRRLDRQYPALDLFGNTARRPAEACVKQR